MPSQNATLSYLASKSSAKFKIPDWSQHAIKRLVSAQQKALLYEEKTMAIPTHYFCPLDENRYEFSVSTSNIAKTPLYRLTLFGVVFVVSALKPVEVRMISAERKRLLFNVQCNDDGDVTTILFIARGLLKTLG